MLVDVSHAAVARSVETLYTFLYGMFPCNVVAFLKGYFEVRRREYASSFVTEGIVEAVEDPFEGMRRDTEFEDMDEDKSVSDRIMVPPFYFSSLQFHLVVDDWFVDADKFASDTSEYSSFYTGRGTLGSWVIPNRTVGDCYEVYGITSSHPFFT